MLYSGSILKSSEIQPVYRISNGRLIQTSLSVAKDSEWIIGSTVQSSSGDVFFQISTNEYVLKNNYTNLITIFELH
ncbi:hypothetical protein ABM34_02690 [Companilactobacillus ginsenosidimutans]|uniref:DUF5776 domain-containing protein n=1 Tax=Companilactobacillus ginsenosidimutans TaxID=1007676 RepID=A0A0H4QF47_9LACO|nr:hypothetical protein ABM34_02690 [Companilactobacillus ginsenosidimutans]